MKLKSRLLILFFLGLDNLIFSQVYSKMQMIPAEHWIYDAISTLKREEKSVDILDNAPLSVSELYDNFLEINYESLTEESQKLYDEVSVFFEKKKPLVTFKPIELSLNAICYPELLYKSNENIDWTFATDYTGKVSYNYDIKAYQNNSYGAASNFYNNSLTRPFLSFPFYINFADYFCVESDFFIGKNFYGFSKNSNFTNIILSADEAEYLWPNYAYGSFGYLFSNGFGFDFQVGKQGLQFGRTLTGSVILNNTFQTDAFVKLSLHSKSFRLDMDVVQVTKDHFLYLHSFEAAPFKWLKLGSIEGTYLDQPFEIRFLNPLMIFHSYQAWNQYNTPEEYKYYREAHTCAYLGITFDLVPAQGLRIYGLFAQTEIQPPNELHDDYGKSLPNGMGFQLGSEYSLPINTGYLKFASEFFYLSPYLYIKQSEDWSLLSKSNSNSYTWIGSPFGPDSAGFELSATYNIIKKLKCDIKYLYVAHGENSFGMFQNTFHKDDSDWAAFFPSVLKNLGLISQEEAENIARNMGLSGTVQHTNQISLYSSYQLNDHLIFDSSLTYSFIFNNKNIADNFAHGIQISTGCEIRLF